MGMEGEYDPSNFWHHFTSKGKKNNQNGQWELTRSLNLCEEVHDVVVGVGALNDGPVQALEPFRRFPGTSDDSALS